MKKHFETESKRILDLMINSIYTNKEIFIRELVSNASDAIDKRYYNQLNSENAIDKSDFNIFLEINENDRILSISDNGIGMSKEELENNLGTIAKSGSLDFKNLNKNEEISIIGQFGVGFYSSFMVADKIEVLTKKEGEKAYLWMSEGADGYEISESTKDEIGTTIKLYIKEDTEDDDFSEYLNQGLLKHLIKKYSNYIKYPIKMEITKKVPKESEDQEFEEIREVETLNSMVPIWKKNKNELSDEDYKNFYHAQRYGFDDPLSWVHLSAEGMINYKAILYIPTQKPMQFYTSNFSGGLELYSNGVMIMEKNENLLPEYLSFVKGMVDSEDLSLNISREMLQNNRKFLSIAKNLEKKVLAELKSILSDDRDKYVKFYEIFGLSLKAGIYESQGSKKKDLEDLLLFRTSKSKDFKTLGEYIDDKKDDQKFIYYATGESYDSIKKQPSLKIFENKEIEVIFLQDHIDEFVIKLMSDYHEVKFKAAFEEEFEEEKVEDEKTDAEKSNEKSLIEEMKSVLREEVVEVKLSKRLVDDASFLTSKGDISIEMEKTLSLQEQNYGLKAQKVLEINPNHMFYNKLLDALSHNDKEKIKTITNVLYNQARLIAGLKIEDVVEFTREVNSLIK